MQIKSSIIDKKIVYVASHMIYYKLNPNLSIGYGE